jgi:hypothetical protein
LKKLQSAVKSKSAGCFEVDVLRVSTNFAYFIRTMLALPEEAWTESALAIYWHHFDCHEKCGAFCRRKDETAEQRSKSNKFYRSKEKDHELFTALEEIMSRFISMEKLKEVAHSYDTNPNEAMNGLIAWIAPKNKHYSGTQSLRTRVAVAVSIQCFGFESFFRMVFERLSIEMTPGTENWLQDHNKRREKRRSNSKLISSKKNRKAKHYIKVKVKTAQAQKDLQKGTNYSIGSGCDPEETVPEQTQTSTTEPPKKKARKPCRCGSNTHQKTNSLQCKLNKSYKDASPEIIAKLEMDEADQDAFDTMNDGQDYLAAKLNKLEEEL